MSVFDQDCFLFVPASDSINLGTFYTLERSAQRTDQCVVLIPYSNPTLQKPKALYFSVKEELNAALPEPVVPSPHLQLKALISREEYLKQITKLKQHIQRGDIYEINYCVAYEVEGVEINPIEVFQRLRSLTMAPYSMLLKNGEDYLLCASPELFLKREGKQLITKPIKGTAKRGATPEEDAELKKQLHNSLKERTENVMAVDVARNDLSQVASRGSVQVPSLYAIESFATVHQMVSTVTCEISPDCSFEEIIDCTFPMASMTGAPKRRAMDLCTETEKFDRANYSGALGLYKDGDFELGVVIRSIFYNAAQKKIRIAVGGAITHLCDAETEYEECQLKAKSLLRALNADIINA
jgi:para-aminobenzoate synthetase component 1